MIFDVILLFFMCSNPLAQFKSNAELCWSPKLEWEGAFEWKITWLFLLLQWTAAAGGLSNTSLWPGNSGTPHANLYRMENMEIYVQEDLIYVYKILVNIFKQGYKYNSGRQRITTCSHLVVHLLNPLQPSGALWPWWTDTKEVVISFKDDSHKWMILTEIKHAPIRIFENDHRSSKLPIRLSASED